MRVEVDRLSELGPLAAYRVSDADGPAPAAPSRRIVFLHGFTQNAACIGSFGATLSHDNDLVSVDLPGHGGSEGFADADLWESADLVARTTGPAVYVGYSMGGRVGLHLALQHPESVRALVLIGATAGIEDRELREERRLHDRETAERIDLLGTSAFVAEWLQQPLFATLPTEARFMEERGRNDPAALAASLRNTGTGSMEPLWGRLGEIRCHVLVVCGQLDGKFTEIGARMAAEIGPNATVAVVPESGHSVHLEQPDKCGQLVAEFLDSNTAI